MKVRVSGKALQAHVRHAAIVPAPSGGCPRTVLTPNAGGRAFSIALTGESASPAGDPVATGTATVRLRAGQGQLCYRLAADNLPAASASHIHRGAAGVNGPVVVPFTAPGVDGNSSGCQTSTAALIDEIIGSPAGFYVNVHTKEHPGGAIRQQLG